MSHNSNTAEMVLKKVLYVISTLLCYSGVTLAACPPSQYTDSNGTIQSPGFNTGKYDADMNCTYNIRVSPGQRITLEFQNLSILGSMPECAEDSVEIFVGCSNVTIGKFCSCSNVSIPKIYSFDHCMTLVFKSDGASEGKGFQVQYTTADNNVTKLDPQNNCSTDSLTPSHGTLYSPNWPLMYPLDAFCAWVFNPPQTTTVRFFFTSLNLDRDGICANMGPGINDDIRINGTNTTGGQITIKKRICNKLASLSYAFFPIKDMEVIEVRFESNSKSSEDGTGFIAGYATYIKGYVDPNAARCVMTPAVSSSIASTTADSTSQSPTPSSTRPMSSSVSPSDDSTSQSPTPSSTRPMSSSVSPSDDSMPQSLISPSSARPTSAMTPSVSPSDGSGNKQTDDEEIESDREKIIILLAVAIGILGVAFLVLPIIVYCVIKKMN